MSPRKFDRSWFWKCMKWIVGAALVAGVACILLVRELNQAKPSRNLWQLWLAVTIFGGLACIAALIALRMGSRKPKHVRLGSILRWRHNLSDDILNEIAAKAKAQGKYLGEMAVELRYISSAELDAALREQGRFNSR